MALEEKQDKSACKSKAALSTGPTVALELSGLEVTNALSRLKSTASASTPRPPLFDLGTDVDASMTTAMDVADEADFISVCHIYFYLSVNLF